MKKEHIEFLKQLQEDIKSQEKRWSNGMVHEVLYESKIHANVDPIIGFDSVLYIDDERYELKDADDAKIAVEALEKKFNIKVDFEYYDIYVRERIRELVIDQRDENVYMMSYFGIDEVYSIFLSRNSAENAVKELTAYDPETKYSVMSNTIKGNEELGKIREIILETDWNNFLDSEKK